MIKIKKKNIGSVDVNELIKEYLQIEKSVEELTVATEKILQKIDSLSKKHQKNEILLVEHDENHPEKKPKYSTYRLDNLKDFLTFNSSSSFCFTGPMLPPIYCKIRGCPFTITRGGKRFILLTCYTRVCLPSTRIRICVYKLLW